MAPEILQLLLLLSLGNSGNLGRTWAEHQSQEVKPKSPGSRGQEDQAEEEHRQLEGETFRVNCTYKPQERGKRWMAWCKNQENRKDCDSIVLEITSNFSLLGRECFSSYDSSSGILTITMFELRVNDSGVYECGIPEANSNRQKALRRFHLVVSPVQTQSPRKWIQTTSEVTSNNQVTNRFSTIPTVPPSEKSSTLSTTPHGPLGHGSPEMKFLILGVVLSCLLLSVLLAVGILCAKRSYQKAGKGDDSKSLEEKSKGSARKTDSDETAEEIHYAAVSNRSLREPTDCKFHTPVENVQYATIKRN